MTYSDYISSLTAQCGGGQKFENYRRNELIVSSLENGKIPTPKKTGTTICGLVCDGCVVLGSDTRATQGSLVADKNCLKLHKIANNIYGAGAGTSADLDHTTQWLESKIELHRLNTRRTPRVSMAVSILSNELFRYQGHKGCAVLLGGVDFSGPSLYKVHPYGSSDRSPFDAMGSGSLSAMAILENGYSDTLTLEEGKKLVGDAIRAGIYNDLGSGGNVDICVITTTGGSITRAFVEQKPSKVPIVADFKIGTTPILMEKIQHIKSLIEVVEIPQDVEMASA